MDDLTGRLILATPALTDPNFDRTVVLVLEHDEDEGALGIVLNRPSHVDVATALPGWERLAAPPPLVHVGGPVDPQAVIALGRSAEPGPGVTPVVGGVGIVNVSFEPDDLVGSVFDVRLYAGYAGWAPGQLEDEIEAGAWFVVDATPEDPLRFDVDDLWRSVLKRQKSNLRMFATFPADPSMN